jgi:pyruvate formate lyase activating enzyme
VINAPESNRAAATADRLAIAGLARLSVCDWPGRLVATVFLQGCPWRCGYCHNPGLIDARTPGVMAWSQVRQHVVARRGLLDAVVFSGGEPTGQAPLADAMAQVRELGYAVGLHTGGAYPKKLAEILPLTDWVGLDIKGLPSQYLGITGVAAASGRAWQALELVLASGVDYEVRTTVDPRVHTPTQVASLISELQGRGVRNVVLQEARLPAGEVVGRTAGQVIDALATLPAGVSRRAG